MHFKHLKIKILKHVVRFDCRYISLRAIICVQTTIVDNKLTILVCILNKLLFISEFISTKQDKMNNRIGE